MADIDFEVDYREIRSLDDDMREPWPEVGMTCDVPGCSVFNKHYRKYIKDWKKVHSATVEIYCCSKCKTAKSERCDLKRHYIESHKMTNFEAVTNLQNSASKELQNKKIISPGRILPRKKNTISLM